MSEEDDFVRRSQAHQARMMMPGAFIDTDIVTLHPRPLSDGKAIARLAFLSCQKAQRKERRLKRARCADYALVMEGVRLAGAAGKLVDESELDYRGWPIEPESDLTVGMYANPQDVLSKD